MGMRMKTIAIIASCDTKLREVEYMKSCLHGAGMDTLVVDISVGLVNPSGADITREEVFQQAGFAWDNVRTKSKGELVGLMAQAAQAAVRTMYRERRINGILSAGGVQNTSVASAAMRQLPVGFPKVLVTTLASGKKAFGDVVGDKDIVVMPSISDFTGINSNTGVILANACACVAGMVKYAGHIVKKGSRPTVGVTLMGITNTGCCAAIDELERLGVEAIGFHATGVGGSVMEQYAADGILDGILDMTTHEIASEYMGGGFSHGAANRLVAPVTSGIPMVVCPGGLDFVDYAKSEFPPRMEQRRYNMHNSVLAHIKLLPDEAAEVGRIFAERLNLSRHGARLVIPTNGMRLNTRPGEDLHQPETDQALVDSILQHLQPKARVEMLEGNLNEADWGKRVARIMVEELEAAGISTGKGGSNGV